ncbi:glucose 1-dehydrogenase [Cytobacillus suaedae]|nr:glucose 1-dehydrogenase [Cytobacillus suaedae]
MKFENKIVIITGAGNGIGRGIALEYAKNGAKVVVADIDEEAGHQVISEIKEMERDAIYIKTDVTNQDEIIHLMTETLNAYNKIDILINNAGISRWKSVFELEVEEWDTILNTNLRSVFLCSREAAKHMKGNPKGGSIVNMASTRAFMSEKNSEAYAASKGGIVALTHALAVSLGEHNITVNSISPGWIEVQDYTSLREVDHKQHPSRRVGQSDDIARACLFLTNSENNFITGENMIIDGGMTRKMIYEE